MLSRKFKVTLIEDNIAWADKVTNMAQLKRNMQNIDDDTDLVVLPELFTTGFITQDRAQAEALSETNTGDVMNLVHEMSQKYNVAIAGSFLAHTAGQLYNRGFIVEPSGEDTFYDKRHLFTMAGEQSVFNRGVTATAPTIRFRGFNIKLIVCYDLRFPVFCRNVNNEYDLLVVVANWPMARRRAWQQLLIARAIENECYVCGVNRCGTDPQGVDFGEGTSMIADFKGKMLAQRTAASPIVSAEFTLADLQRFREKFPAWQDADTFRIL